jgi:hypothetical protein
MKWNGISQAGESAETWFCRITGAVRLSRGSRGDASLNGVVVEIKDASGGTINQARPLRAMPLVAWSAGVWYVVSVQRLVELALTRARGQHTEHPLECIAIPLSEIADCVCDQSELTDRVNRAVASDELRTALATCHRELRELVSLHADRLGSAFSPSYQPDLFASRK